MLLIINILGQLISDLGLADEFVNYIVIPLDKLLFWFGGLL